MRPKKLNSPPPLLKLASITPNSFVDTDLSVGVNAIRSMPPDDKAQNIRIRIQYGTLCMKYGATSLVMKEGRTSARRTTDLGILGPEGKNSQRLDFLAIANGSVYEVKVDDGEKGE